MNGVDTLEQDSSKDIHLLSTLFCSSKITEKSASIVLTYSYLN